MKKSYASGPKSGSANLNCQGRESRRVKAYPHVPADEAGHAKAVQAWVSLDKKLAWACWGFICTIGCVLVGALVTLTMEIL